MANQVTIISQNETDDNWNSVVLSLATNGGFIISNGRLSSIRVCSPKFNYDTLLLDNVFQTYFIETKKLNELYLCIFEQQDELNIHNEDKDEQEKIDTEREEALLALKNINKKSVIIDESDHDFHDDEHHEHDGD